uniref:Distal membrane arm assembly complex 2-like protein n=1 Tax=Macrostomum lignano TaxID=282301 RepID=A0A1I8FME0_9PLAT
PTKHYNRKSFRRHFDSWLQFHLYGGGGGWSKSEEFWPKLMATSFRLNGLLRFLQRAFFSVSVVRVMFKAWHGVSLEARKTREYFERLERRDNVPRDVGAPEVTGEARDAPVASSAPPEPWADMSRAPASVAPRKAHTPEAPSCWHKLDFGQVRQQPDRAGWQTVPGSVGPAARPPQPWRLAGTFRWRSSQCIGACRNCRTRLPLARLSRAVRWASSRDLWFTRRISDNSLTLGVAKQLRMVAVPQPGQLAQQLSGRGPAVPGFRDRRVHKLEPADLEWGRGGSGSGLALPSVEHYELFGCSSLTDDSFRAISNRSLRVLKLDKNDIITDAAFGHLGRRCPELHQLCVADCVRVTDQALKAIGQLRYIRVLNLADCVRLSDAGAKSIAEASFAQSLRELNLTNAVRSPTTELSFCENLTHLSADSLANYCPGLVSLDMSGTGMNDSAMSVLGSLSRMRYLYLANCPQVTDLGLQKLVQQLRYLEHLDLSHCVQLTDGGIRWDPGREHSSVKQLSSVGLIKLTMNITSYCK